MGDLAMKKEARDSGYCPRAKVSNSGRNRDTAIVQQPWTRAQCRAMEIGLGGGFIVLAILEAMFRW